MSTTVPPKRPVRPALDLAGYTSWVASLSDYEIESLLREVIRGYTVLPPERQQAMTESYVARGKDPKTLRLDYVRRKT